MKNDAYLKLLKDVCASNCPVNDRYCFLKEMICQTHKFDHRFIFQLKCVEIFKYDESIQDKKDIGWELAWERWVQKGYAKKFSDVYNPLTNENDILLSPTEVYIKVKGK